MLYYRDRSRENTEPSSSSIVSMDVKKLYCMIYMKNSHNIIDKMEGKVDIREWGLSQKMGMFYLGILVRMD